MSLGSKHITSPAQLRGKRVGDAGIPYQHAYLQTILQRAGVPAGSVKEINVGDNLVPAMLSGRVDATLGAYWNYEAIQLRQQGKRPNVIHMEKRRRARLRRAGPGHHRERDRQPHQRAAPVRTGPRPGLRGGAQRPAGGRRRAGEANPALQTKLQLASVKATLPYYFPGGGHPWGWQDQPAVEQLRPVDARPII